MARRLGAPHILNLDRVVSLEQDDAGGEARKILGEPPLLANPDDVIGTRRGFRDQETGRQLPKPFFDEKIYVFPHEAPTLDETIRRLADTWPVRGRDDPQALSRRRSIGYTAGYTDLGSRGRLAPGRSLLQKRPWCPINHRGGGPGHNRGAFPALMIHR